MVVSLHASDKVLGNIAHTLSICYSCKLNRDQKREVDEAPSTSAFHASITPAATPAFWPRSFLMTASNLAKVIAWQEDEMTHVLADDPFARPV